MAEGTPRKYWWVVRVVVPTVLALIGIVPALLRGGGGGDSATFDLEGAHFGGDVTMVGSQVILNQVADAATRAEVEASVERAVTLARTGFAEDAIALFRQIADTTSSAAAYNNLGALLAASGRTEEAESAYKEAIVRDPQSAAVSTNLARLQASTGNLEGALRTLEGAPSGDAAETLRREITRRLERGSMEAEPNDDILSPNRLPLQTAAQGAIAAAGDVDFFVIEGPEGPRDRVEVRLTNGSTVLQPRLRLFNADKSAHSGTASYGYQVTAGQDLALRFTAWPAAKYFLAVDAVGGAGRYEVEVVPLGRFDAYEPNDDIPAAHELDPGDTLSANLMVPDDPDYYRFRASGEQTRVALANRSARLQPMLQLWAADKRLLWQTASYGYQVTAGQDLEATLETEPGGTYYLSVRSVGGSGDYDLTVGGRRLARN